MLWFLTGFFLLAIRLFILIRFDIIEITDFTTADLVNNLVLSTLGPYVLVMIISEIVDVFIDDETIIIDADTIKRIIK
jgi:hypothetical protein